MNTIEKITDLVAALKKLAGKEQIVDLMKNVNIPLEEYERYFSWNDDRYTRNILSATEEFELLLICWEKGQRSYVHDFDSQEAWIHPIMGKLQEERFKKNKEGNLVTIASLTLDKSDFSYMNQIGIHRYTNVYESRSASLHAYLKPVVKWRAYDLVINEYETVTPWVDKNYQI